MQITSAIAILLLCSTRGHGYKLFNWGGGLGHRLRAMKNVAETKTVNVDEIMRNEESSTSDFGTALFSQLCAKYPSGNVLFSPLSVSQALALVRDGATEGSHNEMELEELLGSQHVQDQASLLQHQSEGNDADAGVQLKMATSIWANDLKQSYINAAARGTQNAEALKLPNMSFNIPLVFFSIQSLTGVYVPGNERASAFCVPLAAALM